GRPFEVSNDVSSWYHGSVSSLHLDVRTPSQSMSMSDFQKNAEPDLQMFTVEASPSSVAYLPCEATVQFLTLASSALALGPLAACAAGATSSVTATALQVVARATSA